MLLAMFTVRSSRQSTYTKYFDGYGIKIRCVIHILNSACKQTFKLRASMTFKRSMLVFFTLELKVLFTMVI